jgi:MFS family permease
MKDMKMTKGLRRYAVYSSLYEVDLLAPVKLLYFYSVTGSYAQAAAAISVAWLAAVIFEIPTGIFSDRIGRKKTIVLGTFTISVGYVCYLLAGSFVGLALGATLHGIARSFFSRNNNAYLYELVDQEGGGDGYSVYYGRLKALSTAAYVASSLVSGIVIGVSPKLLMAISLLFVINSLVLSFMLTDVSKLKSESTNIFSHIFEAFGLIIGNKKLRYSSLSSIFGGAGEAAYEMQIGVFGAVWPTWVVGVARSVQELVAIHGFWYASRVIDKLKAANMIVMQPVVSWLGNILAVILQSTFSPLFIAIHFFFSGPATVAMETINQQEFSSHQRATIASINSLGSSLYAVLVINIAGIVASRDKPFLGLLVTQLAFLPVIITRFMLRRELKRGV